MKLITCLTPALLWFAAAGLVQSADKQPVHIYLYARVTDHVNIQLSEERLRRVLPIIDNLRKQHPRPSVSASILLSGAVSEALAERNSQTGIKDFVMDYVRRGVIELGYDGTDEPTYHRRSTTDLSTARTAEERWLARGEAVERFLTEARDPLTGDPLAGRSGGLKRMQEIFGPAAIITGVTEDLGGDSEMVQHLSRYNDRALIFGTPDPDSSRNIHGYRGSAQELGTEMAPVPNASTELFWQDNFLRSSETSDAAIRRLSGYEGVEALQPMLAKVDRSHVRIVHVELGDQRMYLNADYARGLMYPPLALAYRHPEHPKLPEEALRSTNEVTAAYAKEEALVRWLAEDFFPANPGSHFVSSSDLRQMTPASVGFELSFGKLRADLANLLKTWDDNTLYPPVYFSSDGRYLSLADMFQVMTDALSELHRTGKFPQSVKVVQVYGPVPVPDDHGPNMGDVTVRMVAEAADGLHAALHSTSSSPLPQNRVPSWVTIGGKNVNAAQFLRLMAEAVVAATPEARLKIKMTNVLSVVGEVAPKTRLQADQGATWTIKPAPLEQTPVVRAKP